MIANTFRAICVEPVAADGVVFDATALQATPIREEMVYAGIRVRTRATIDGARIPIQIDISFGDVVTPAPVEIDYPTLLDNLAPHLRAYPVETVVAEKFEALTTLGVANSRLKDFYDLWLIAQTFELRQAALIEAVHRTFERRGTRLPLDTPAGLTDAFVTAWGRQWSAFLGRERMAAAPDSLITVLVDLRAFLMPLVVGVSAEDRVWLPGGPWAPQV